MGIRAVEKTVERGKLGNSDSGLHEQLLDVGMKHFSI
jgi:hypothetical protein